LEIPEQFRRRMRSSPTQETERKALLAVLQATNWNKTEAAQRLNWSRMTLYRKMAKYKIAALPSAG
jgi:transcriptional regulator of acetoin/glycerol metabolism